MTRWMWGSLLLLFLMGAPAEAQQPPRPGRLTITVADQTGAIIPNATVTLTGQEPATSTAKVAPVQTSPQGVAIVDGLLPGRYQLQAEFEGFDTAIVRDVRVRSGDNRQNVVLTIKKVEDSVVVGQDAASAASDRRGPTFGTVLTREQIDALSDDADEARRQLQELAGPGAVIRVDSFEGSPLPPKSQIRMIRISRDQFAAENHSAGGLIIEIVSQPGLGPLRGTFNTRLRDGSMTGRNPFHEKKGPERAQDYNFNLGGSLARGKTSFTLGVGGTTAFDTPTLNVARVSGTRSETLMRRPRENVSASFSLDHALTLDQTLRIGGNRSTSSSRNLGIGDWDEVERAYETEGSTYNFRAQHVGPVGRRFFINNRIQLGFTESESRSAVEAPTIRVLDAFTSGGAQQTGGARTRRFNAASDLDYVRGRHSVRTGVLLDGAWFSTNANSNYLGTYTFESLEAFQQNRPRSFTRRLGDPNLDYFNLQGAVYVQDDIRIRQNLSLSPGVRYEMQTHVSDFNNIGPRVGVTWAPGAAGRLSLRASAGIFYDWLGTNTYEQTLRVDGFRQRELNVGNPAFPDAGFEGVIPPVNRYLLGDTRLPRQLRFSGGLERGLTRTIRAGVTWAHMRGTSLRRGENLNAPVDGVRPDPAFANVIRVVSDARSRQDTLSVFLSGSLARAPVPGAPPVPASQQPRLDWRRASISGQYTAGWLRNNTDGDFWVAPSGSLDREWGVAPGDIRHRVTLQVSTGFLRNLSASWNLNVSSGSAYTLQSGIDSNGDLIFNDRPEGVDRNTLRATPQVSLNGFFNYSWTFGPPATSTQITGISIVNGVPQAVSINPQQAGRFRIGVQVNAQNITNRANYVGYTGVLTSPLFGRPRDVANPRRFDISLNFGF
jgi:hypothetical protein